MTNIAPASSAATDETTGAARSLGRFAAAISSLTTNGSSLASRLSVRSRAARREADIKRLGESLDRMSDRQLAVLGLSREFLYSQLEDRYDALEARRDVATWLTAERGDAPKAITHVS